MKTVKFRLVKENKKWSIQFKAFFGWEPYKIKKADRKWYQLFPSNVRIVFTNKKTALKEVKKLCLRRYPTIKMWR